MRLCRCNKRHRRSSRSSADKGFRLDQPSVSARDGISSPSAGNSSAGKPQQILPAVVDCRRFRAPTALSHWLFHQLPFHPATSKQHFRSSIDFTPGLLLASLGSASLDHQTVFSSPYSTLQSSFSVNTRHLGLSCL